MAEFKFSCPQCGQKIRGDVGYAGLPINCPACQQPIVVPPPPSQSPIPPASRAAAIKPPGRFKLPVLKKFKLPPKRTLVIAGAGAAMLLAVIITSILLWLLEFHTDHLEKLDGFKRQQKHNGILCMANSPATAQPGKSSWYRPANIATRLFQPPSRSPAAKPPWRFGCKTGTTAILSFFPPVAREILETVVPSSWKKLYPET